MPTGRSSPLDHWSTGTKFLFLLTLALFPLGLALAWTARDSLQDTERAIVDASFEDGQAAARAAESLLARNALALRVAANGALLSNPGDACVATARSLALTPSVASRFALRDRTGKMLCTHGEYADEDDDSPIAPGALTLWISPVTNSVHYNVGLNGGMATGELTAVEIARTVRTFSPRVEAFAIDDGRATLDVIGGDGTTTSTRVNRYRIGGGELSAIIRLPSVSTRLTDRALLFLPLLMWAVAALLSWFLIRRLLLLPLARLERAVTDYRPGESALVLPQRPGAADEIRSLAAAFERVVDQLESSEQQMAEALTGQRRLIREVHHRVKNNLQVIASLLNIHGRSATTAESKAAYAAIGRRVDALSVVHRNHFAEVEESRGIALRPLLTELGQILKASAPDGSTVAIQLDADALNTTQDAAVAVAFFVTELLEFAMLHGTAQSIDIELRRISELAASLTVSSDALVPDNDAPSVERQQFERVIGGLARQLRSPLDQKLGRLGVNLPVFPADAW